MRWSPWRRLHTNQLLHDRMVDWDERTLVGLLGGFGRGTLDGVRDGVGGVPGGMLTSAI